MDFLVLIFEAIVWIFEVLCAGLDVFAWFKGKPNRVERKEAKKAGAEVPARDRWNRRVVVLTIAVCINAIFILILRSKLW